MISHYIAVNVIVKANWECPFPLNGFGFSNWYLHSGKDLMENRQMDPIRSLLESGKQNFIFFYNKFSVIWVLNIACI